MEGPLRLAPAKVATSPAGVFPTTLRDRWDVRNFRIVPRHLGRLYNLYILRGKELDSALWPFDISQLVDVSVP